MQTYDTAHHTTPDDVTAKAACSRWGALHRVAVLRQVRRNVCSVS